MAGFLKRGGEGGGGLITGGKFGLEIFQLKKCATKDKLGH